MGEVTKFYKKIGVAEVLITNESLTEGQQILVTGKKTPANYAKVKEMQIDHKSVNFVGKGTAVGIKLPFEVKPRDKVFLWNEVE